MDSTQTGGNVHWCRWPHRLSISTLLGSKIFGVLHVFFQSSARTQMFPSFHWLASRQNASPDCVTCDPCLPVSMLMMSVSRTVQPRAMVCHVIYWECLAFPCCCGWLKVATKWLVFSPSIFICLHIIFNVYWKLDGRTLIHSTACLWNAVPTIWFSVQGEKKSSKTSMNANVLKQDPNTSSHTLCVVILNKYEC